MKFKYTGLCLQKSCFGGLTTTEGVFGKLSTKWIVSITHGKAASRHVGPVLPAGLATLRECKPPVVRCSGLVPPIHCTHTKLISLKNPPPLFNSALKCFKSFLEMISVALPVVEMTLGLCGLQRKTNQPTKGRVRNQAPVSQGILCVPLHRETKASHQGLPHTQWGIRTENEVWVCKTEKGKP